MQTPNEKCVQAWKLAEDVAKSKTKGRNYSDDVLGDAYLAVAQGITDRPGIENAVRRSMRQEWAFAEYHAPLATADQQHRAEAPERAKVDLWEHVQKLPPRQRDAVVLVFWDGLTQEEAAARMGVAQECIVKHLKAAFENLKKILRRGYKKRSLDAVSK